VSLLELALIFASNFVFIGLKAFQQRNVTAEKYALIHITSMLMAAVEVYVIWKMAEHGPTLELVLTLGAAGGTGASLATWLHKRHVSPTRPAVGYTGVQLKHSEADMPMIRSGDTVRDRRSAVT